MKPNLLRRSGIAALLLTSVLLAAPLAARADGPVEPRALTKGVFPSELAYVNILVSIAAASTTVTTLIENGIVIRNGWRPTRLWRALGYALGSACVGLGALNIATSEGRGLKIGAGAALAAIGMVDLGLVVWGGRQAEPSQNGPWLRLVFGPRVLTDIAGKPAYGVGLSLADW